MYVVQDADTELSSSKSKIIEKKGLTGLNNIGNTVSNIY